MSRATVSLSVHCESAVDTSTIEVRSSTAPRLHYIDKLKVAVIFMVIAHHSGQAYGPTGGRWPISSAEISAMLGPFFAVNAMFGMGLLFLISGYFTANSLERKNPAEFLRGRIIRLGIPTLIFALFVFGPASYISQPEGTSFLTFVGYLYSTAWQELYAHLWFLIHLLVYSAAYLVLRELLPDRKMPEEIKRRVPTRASFLVFVVVLALTTFVVRIWYPIDVWIPFLFLVPVEIAHLPQYASMFAVGILVARWDYLCRLPTTTGIEWLIIGLIAAMSYYLYDLGGLKFLPVRTARGGWDWGSLVFCLWEALVCVGLSVGLLVLFREKCNTPGGKILSALANAAFGAYIIHLLIVIGLQAGLAPISLAPLIKFALVTVTAIALSFSLAYLAQQCRWLKKVL